MIEQLFNFISKQQEILVLVVLLLFSSVEIFGGLLKNTQRSAGDLIQEITGFMLLSIVINLCAENDIRSTGKTDKSISTLPVL